QHYPFFLNQKSIIFLLSILCGFNVRRLLILLLVAGDLSNSAATATLPVDSRRAGGVSPKRVDARPRERRASS
ncbi:hypothetical protein LINGRAHAP2_LOCUS19296, partial [Linum grandiflorum]